MKNAARYRVGDFFFVLAGMAAFQRQVPGQLELVVFRGLAQVPEHFGLGARPIGAAVLEQLDAELEHGLGGLAKDEKDRALFYALRNTIHVYIGLTCTRWTADSDSAAQQVTTTDTDRRYMVVMVVW